MGERVCFLAGPHYGGLAAGTARALFGAQSKDPNLRVRVACQGNSLLAHCFNQFWVWALNAKQEGQQIDLFAMLHADVAPEPYWLDVLIAELDAGPYDLVSAVVPIKDSRGLSSTAISRPDPDDGYDVDFRLTMAEALSLPETFTAADCGFPDRFLLVNTGCWVCRFDPSWAEQVWFEIRSRVHKDAKGKWQAEVDPEDWNFSRMVQRLGLRVAATRKVKLVHHGDMAYGNQSQWGEWTFDKDKLAEPRMARTTEEALTNG